MMCPAHVPKKVGPINSVVALEEMQRPKQFFRLYNFLMFFLFGLIFEVLIRPNNCHEAEAKQRVDDSIFRRVEMKINQCSKQTLQLIERSRHYRLRNQH